jgi:hypothetical protein
LGKRAPMRGGGHLVSPFSRRHCLSSHLRQRRQHPLGPSERFVSRRELDGKWGDLLNALATTAFQHRLYDLSLPRVHHHRGLHVLSPIHTWPRHLVFATAVLNLLDESSGGGMVGKRSFDGQGYLPGQSLHSSP